MPHFNILKEITPSGSYRVACTRSMFDVEMKTVRERFCGDIPIESFDWNIGVIYGASGSGKSSIANELFSENIVRLRYDRDSVLDDFMLDDIKQITQTLCAVGFASPPSWLKPYAVLSSGEQMRADLARALLEGKDLIVFDEYTSVVDRQIARIGSAAISKAIRRMGKKFIAVTCHGDVLDWLGADWVFCTNNMKFEKKNWKGQECEWSLLQPRNHCGRILESITI